MTQERPNDAGEERVGSRMLARAAHRRLSACLACVLADAVRKQAEQTLEQMLNSNPVRRLSRWLLARSSLLTRTIARRLASSSRSAVSSQTTRQTQSPGRLRVSK